METRLRLKLVLAGLPRPVAQVEIYDSQGNFIARPDFVYPDHKLAIEYNGSNHRDNWAADIRRQNLLLAEGWELLRFTAADLQEGADTVVFQVGAALNHTPPGKRTFQLGPIGPPPGRWPSPPPSSAAG